MFGIAVEIFNKEAPGISVGEFKKWKLTGSYFLETNGDFVKEKGSVVMPQTKFFKDSAAQFLTRQTKICERSIIETRFSGLETGFSIETNTCGFINYKTNAGRSLI
jgi:hypothetical protein